MNAVRIKRACALTGLACIALGAYHACTTFAVAGVTSAQPPSAWWVTTLLGNAPTSQMPASALSTPVTLASAIFNDVFVWIGVAVLALPYVFELASSVSTRRGPSVAIPRGYVPCKRCHQAMASSSRDCPHCGAVQREAL